MRVRQISLCMAMAAAIAMAPGMVSAQSKEKFDFLRDKGIELRGGAQNDADIAKDPSIQEMKLVPGGTPSPADIAPLVGPITSSVAQLQPHAESISNISIAPYSPLASFVKSDAARYGVGAFAVGIGFNESSFCTGVLVSSIHVLTAGHCACGEPSTYRIVTAPRIPVTDDGKGRRIAGKPILFDKRSCDDPHVAIPGRDLALLVLENEIPCPKGAICAIGVPSAASQLGDKLRRGRRLFVAGYGLTDKGEARFRNEGDIPVLSADCGDQTPEVCLRFQEMVLADLEKPPGQRVDTCGGDSGAPVFMIEPEGPILIAITSRAAPWSVVDAHSCGSGGVYETLGRASVWSWLHAAGVTTANSIEARNAMAGMATASAARETYRTKVVAGRSPDPAPTTPTASRDSDFDCKSVIEPGADPQGACWPTTR